MLAELRFDGFFVLSQIDFCQGNHCVTHVQIAQDLQMLLGLWHPAVVRGDDEQRQINRADARHHVFHEIFVAGNVDDAELEG